jgi:hypothetical protein
MPMGGIVAVAMQQLKVRVAVIRPIPILVVPFDQIIARLEQSLAACTPSFLSL